MKLQFASRGMCLVDWGGEEFDVDKHLDSRRLA